MPVIDRLRRFLGKKTYSELAKENASLRESINGLTEFGVKSVNFKDGVTDISFSTAKNLVLLMADAMAKCFDKEGGINYVQYEVDHMGQGEKYILILHKRGSKTPHELRQEAEKRAEEAESKLAALKGKEGTE